MACENTFLKFVSLFMTWTETTFFDICELVVYDLVFFVLTFEVLEGSVLKICEFVVSWNF